MKIELTKEQTFTARAGANAIHGLRIASEWKGLTEFEDSIGRNLIVNDGVVVKGSQALINHLRHGCRKPGFIPFPQSTLPSGRVVPAFDVSQYLCSKGDDGKILISATAKPWTNISHYGAMEACVASGYDPEYESRALALLWDAVNVDENWTGGKVGKGKMFQGLHKGTVREAQAGDYVSSDPEERRYFVLSTGDRIYDMSGNLFRRIFDDIQGNEKGLIARAFESISPSLSTAPYPSMKNGMGYRPPAGTDWSGHALVRGGFWRSDDSAGAFRLGGDWPGNEHDIVGFRCTKSSSGL
jgi:hypothetical protein